MANPISRHRKATWAGLLIIWLVVVFTIFFQGFPWLGVFIPILVALDTTLRIGIFSTLIAAGIPALYQIHTTWVKQPEITTQIGYSKTFLRNRAARCDSCGWHGQRPFYRNLVEQQNLSLGQCPQCKKHTIEQITQVIPTLFANLRIKNVGEQTARNSFVTFGARPDERWYGRWAVPENPEKFNLHPKDERDVHIFRTYISFNDNHEEIKDGETYVLAPHSEFLILDNDEADFKDDNLEIRSQYPETERPEERGESSNAGWRGNRLSIPPTTNFEIEYSYSAEDWYSDDRTETIQLNSELTNREHWQSSWENRLTDTVDYIEDRLSETLS